MRSIKQKYPILEFDPSRSAVIRPEYSINNNISIPTNGVACFFNDVIDKLLETERIHLITSQRSEMGYHPIYGMDHNGREIAVYHPCVGGPLASALLEEIISLGCNTIIVCGGAGALTDDLNLGQIIVPVSAIRDEGTSYHYLSPSREAAPNQEAFNAILDLLDKRNVDYLVGKTWTTDAVYRETTDKIALRKVEGCLTVDMEAATLFAVAQYRKIRLAQLLYAGDSVATEIWSHRKWNDQFQTRESLFKLACDVCVSL